MDFAQVIKDRYSYKKYDGKPVTAEQLSSILEAGRLAPTAKNLQEQHIYVVQSAEGLAKIDKLTPCRYGAPTVLVVAFNKDSVFTYPGGKHSSGAEDAAIVATHLMLAATNAAVDSCWINFFDPEAAAKAGSHGIVELCGQYGQRHGNDHNDRTEDRQDFPQRNVLTLGLFVGLFQGLLLHFQIIHYVFSLFCLNQPRRAVCFQNYTQFALVDFFLPSL